ncbi:MAG: hypothetical protein LBS87_01615 [Puniceicoccales bacterium]|nr:hypothetical protein [Puniceicoccales bacterium]
MRKEKEKQASEKTFGEAYEEYIKKYAKIENKYREWKDTEWRLGKVLPYLSEMKLSSITRHEMQGMHSRICRENGGEEHRHLKMRSVGTWRQGT